MSEEKEKHPFYVLSELIGEYKEKKNSFSLKELQDMRENISLQLFYLSDDASKAISNYDLADWERKRNYAELIEAHKYDEDGNKNTVAAAESRARIENKEYEEAVVNAIRQKERVRIILSSVNQILNAISSRLNQIQQ